MLTGYKIRKKLGTDIIIIPFNDDQLNPNSYNVTLNEEILVYEKEYDDGGNLLPIDMKKDNPTKKLIIPEEGLVLYPDELYLGRTNEYTETRNFIPCYDGRSSTARLGISSHICAGFGDIGFKGTWTLEITCVRPVRIYPNIEIGQLYYFKPNGEIGKQYMGKYQGQKEPQASKLYSEL